MTVFFHQHLGPNQGSGGTKGLCEYDGWQKSESEEKFHSGTV
jgi:hypothetical protein